MIRLALLDSAVHLNTADEIARAPQLPRDHAHVQGQRRVREWSETDGVEQFARNLDTQRETVLMLEITDSTMILEAASFCTSAVADRTNARPNDSASLGISWRKQTLPTRLREQAHAAETRIHIETRREQKEAKTNEQIDGCFNL